MTLFPNCRALVVDDEPLILLDASAILEEAGFQVVEAASGDEALAILAKQAAKIDLLFSDVDMFGETDGFALARHAAWRFPHIAIVVASGRVRPEAGDLPDRASFLPKPYNSRIVIEHLQAKTKLYG